MKSIKNLIREQVKINESFRSETRSEPEPEPESFGAVRESGQSAVPDVAVTAEAPKKKRGRKPRAKLDE